MHAQNALAVIARKLTPVPTRRRLATAIRQAGTDPMLKLLAQRAEAGEFDAYADATAHNTHADLAGALRIAGAVDLAKRVNDGEFRNDLDDAVTWLSKFSARVEAIKAERRKEEECVLELQRAWLELPYLSLQRELVNRQHVPLAS